MIYCFICKDGPDAPRLRKEHLEAHLDHIEKVVGSMPVAGPVSDADGAMCASLIMIDAKSETAAWDIFNQDPYAKARIWSSVEVLPFAPAAGTWLGGVTWKKC